MARLVLACVWVLASTGRALGGEAASEYSIKAAYLYNFAQYIEWPSATYASRQDAIVLGVYGDGPLPPDLAAINGRCVHGHGQNRCILLKHISSLGEIDHCQMLFVMHSEQLEIAAIMR